MNPGLAYNCRCVAIPVLNDEEDGDEDDPDGGEDAPEPEGADEEKEAA